MQTIIVPTEYVPVILSGTRVRIVFAEAKYYGKVGVVQKRWYHKDSANSGYQVSVRIPKVGRRWYPIEAIEVVV